MFLSDAKSHVRIFLYYFVTKNKKENVTFQPADGTLVSTVCEAVGSLLIQQTTCTNRFYASRPLPLKANHMWISLTYRIYYQDFATSSMFLKHGKIFGSADRSLARVRCVSGR